MYLIDVVILLQVVLVANSLPALNDVTAMELPDIVAEAAKVCIHSSLFSSSPYKLCRYLLPNKRGWSAGLEEIQNLFIVCVNMHFYEQIKGAGCVLTPNLKIVDCSFVRTVISCEEQLKLVVFLWTQ